MVGLRRKAEVDGIHVFCKIFIVLEGLYRDREIRAAEFTHPATDTDFRSFGKDLAVFQYEKLLGAEGDTYAATLTVLLPNYVEIALFLFSHILLYA
jgi:hypothetical protein